MDVNEKIVVVEKVLRDAGNGGAHGVGDGEQENAGGGRLLLIFDPAENIANPVLACEEKQVENENHPGQSERSHELAQILRCAKTACSG